MNRITKIYVVFLCAIGVFGYPDGAPERACYRLMPRHTHPFTRRAIKAQPSTIKAPYNITLNRHTWNPDIPVKVTIHGGAPFKGFMLMAAEDSLMDMPTGTFDPTGGEYHKHTNPDAKTMFCTVQNDAVTHTNNNWKSHITVDWYAPAFTSADAIQFIATVVTNRSTVWTNIRSAFLQADPNIGEMPEVGEAAEGGLFPGGFGGGGGMGGKDPWGYPTTPSYAGWDGGFTGGFGRGSTPGYTTMRPDTPVQSEVSASRQEQMTSGSESRSRAAESRRGNRRNQNDNRWSSAGDQVGSRTGPSERRGGGQGRWGEGNRRGSWGEGGRNRGAGGGRRGGGWGQGGRRQGRGMGGEMGGTWGGGEGGFGGRFQQMFMQWLLGGGGTGGGNTGRAAGRGVTSNPFNSWTRK